MKSCTGKILCVDLTNKTTKVEMIPEKVYDAVLSGKGLAAWYLYKNIPSGADPLGEDNILAFVSGALTGTGALLCGRWTVACKSPLTGTWGDANCGGIFSPAIKQCGYDGIFFSGISETPVYLYCDDNTVELRDASPYWGLDAVEAEKRLKAECSGKKRPSVALIGTAGEKLSLISGIVNEGGRIAARSGVGAVMGSKRLKAVVLAGTQPMPCADKAGVEALSQELGSKIVRLLFPSGTAPVLSFGGAAIGKLPVIPIGGMFISTLFRHWGTPSNEPMAITSGDGPIKNWAGTPKDTLGALVALNPDKINRMEERKYHCYACPLGCGGMLNVKGNPFMEDGHSHKPEYETINCFGPLLLNNDLDSILYINELLNRGGMDSISAGNTVAWAIESFENGILTLAQTDGLELRWGNKEAIVELVRRMVEREGVFGNDLADGVKRASMKYGGAEFAMHVGGQEPGMHDSRNDPQLAVHYAADPAPGKHTIGMTVQYGALDLSDICSWAPKATLHSKKKALIPNEENALISKANSCYSMLTDGAGGCYYGEMMGVNNWKLIEYLNAAADWQYDGDHYMEIGERIQTLRQMFNIKHGIEPKDIKLPLRMQGYPPLPDGPLKGVQLRNEEQVSLHWKAFGWDEKTGHPLPETIERLGIGELLEL